jgi:hypothetical protein
MVILVFALALIYICGVRHTSATLFRNYLHLVQGSPPSAGTKFHRYPSKETRMLEKGQGAFIAQAAYIVCNQQLQLKPDTQQRNMYTEYTGRI